MFDKKRKGTIVMTHDMTEGLTDLFERANEQFLQKNRQLFELKVSERTLCGALMLELDREIKKKSQYDTYFVDVEYNRNVGGTIKRIDGNTQNGVVINCDLILHSRGNNINIDNLIALEMKKASASIQDKNSDRERLQCLTMEEEPLEHKQRIGIPRDHIRGYELGIFYEVNFPQNSILVEYYRKGLLDETKSFSIYPGEDL